MNDRDEIVLDLTNVVDEARAAFDRLSCDQLNWKPSQDGWSVAQCLDHIRLTNEQLTAEIERKIAGETNSFWESWSPFSGYLGGFLLKSMKADGKKFKAPSETIVPPSDLPGDIVDRFGANIADVKDVVERAKVLDPKRTVLTSPFMPMMTYRLDDALAIIAEHTKRHIRQAKRVLETEGFPR